MAGVLKRNYQKRLDCLKKKSEELSVLCDVDVLFLCKENGSFNLWPEDSNACLSLIDKYKNSKVHAKRDDPTDNLTSALGKRKQRSDDPSVSCKRSRKSEEFQMGSGNCVAFDMGICDAVAVDGQTNNLTSALEKRKQRSDDHSINCERLDKSKEFQMCFSDGEGFDMGIFDGAAVDGGEVFLVENVQDREGLEMGIFDGVAVDEGEVFFFENMKDMEGLEMDIFDGITVDEGEGFLFENVQDIEGFENDIFDRLVAEEGGAFLFENVRDSEGLEMSIFDGISVDGGEAFLCEKAQETEGMEMGIFDGISVDGGGAFLCEKAQETGGLEMGFFDGDVVGGEAFFFDKVQVTEGFQMGFLEDIGFDESQTSSLTSMEQTQEFQKSFLNNSTDNRSSEMSSLKNFVQNIEGIVEGLGSQDLQKIMHLIDQATERVDQRLHQLRDREAYFEIGDSGVDWEELVRIL